MPDTADLTARIERRITKEFELQCCGIIGPIDLTAVAEGVAHEIMMPDKSRVTPLNDIGAHILGIDEELVRYFGVCTEGGSVLVKVKVAERGYPLANKIHEAIQYLTPADAMKFAKAFERCAIEALKESA